MPEPTTADVLRDSNGNPFVYGRLYRPLPWSDERIAELREKHTVDDDGITPCCGECDQDWPCTTAYALATLDARLAAQAEPSAPEGLDVEPTFIGSEFCAPHYHVAGPNDACGECGHDLRALCHHREATR